MTNKIITIYTSVLLVFLGLTLSLNTYGQEFWELAYSEDGIRLFEQPGDKNMQDIKLVYEVEADLPDLVGFLIDEQGFRDLIGNIQKVKLVEKKNDSVRFYYINVGLDPVINRDAIVKVTFSRKPYREVQCKMELDNSIGYKLEHTSVKPFTAQWSLQSLGDQRLLVNLLYSGQIDDYSDWIHKIIEIVFRKQLVNIANGMRTNITKERYQHEELTIW